MYIFICRYVGFYMTTTTTMIIVMSETYLYLLLANECKKFLVPNKLFNAFATK